MASTNNRKLVRVKVVRNEDLIEQIGRDVYFDLVDLDKVRSFSVTSSMIFTHFKVGQLLRRKTGNRELVLLLEGLELRPDLYTFRLRHMTEEDILLFFKLYDPETEEIRYKGNLFVNGNAMPEDILKKLSKMANFDPGEAIILYEEVRFLPAVRCDRVNRKRTFLANQLRSGDIICFQKVHPDHMNCRYPDVPSFFGNLDVRCPGLPEAKPKVIETKDKLKKEEENLANLQLKVMAIKDKLRKAEDVVAPLQFKAIGFKNEPQEADENMTLLQLRVIAKKNELKEIEETMSPLRAKVIAMENELKDAEENMVPSRLKTIAIKDELKEAEENVAALEAKINP